MTTLLLLDLLWRGLRIRRYRRTSMGEEAVRDRSSLPSPRPPRSPW
jgi:hypothetical protein